MAFAALATAPPTSALAPPTPTPPVCTPTFATPKVARSGAAPLAARRPPPVAPQTSALVTPPKLSPAASCVVACPLCKHRLRIPAAPTDAPSATYQCPSCTTRFMVSRRAPDAGGSLQPPSPTADEPANSTLSGPKLFQALCPRCGEACRFTVPAAAGYAEPTNLTVKCVHCTKPFEIQV